MVHSEGLGKRLACAVPYQYYKTKPVVKHLTCQKAWMVTCVTFWATCCAALAAKQGVLCLASKAHLEIIQG